MKIVVAGGTGFLGSPLSEAWAEDGHDVRVLTRSLPPGRSQHDSGTGVPGITRVGWIPDGTAGTTTAVVESANAVINLAGESIGTGRWTASRKRALRDSRLLATRSLAAAIVAASAPPPLFLSGSAIGYYGDTGQAEVTEESSAGTGFFADLCVAWEAEAERAARPDVRVVVLRSGVVLEQSGGSLPRMSRPFRFFVGGRLGSGRQYFSWIHRLDWIEMVRWIVETPGCSGAINATAPEPVTNARLTRALGHALHRPALVPAPAFALRLVLGGLADTVLASQRVIPSRVLQAGFHFRYPEIEIALRGIWGDR
jgi:uncharacterized protein (TIGR01777 family)